MSSSTNNTESTTTVENLVTAFKRRGHFDAIRKSTLASFESTVRSYQAAHLTLKNAETLVSQLKDVVRCEVEKDTNLLEKDRSKSSILIGGAVDRLHCFATAPNR